MNKKGFTLMELLAVIAILAILIIVLLPNIIKLMNDTKKENFSNEIKAIVSTAESQYVMDSQLELNASSIVYSRIDTNYCNKKLDLNGRQDLNFYLEIDSDGKIVRYYASDGTYEYSSEKYGLRVEDILTEDIEEAGLSGERLVISCESPEYKLDGTITSLISGKEINIRMKTLAGSNNPTTETIDENITAIVRSSSEPSIANKQNINLISNEDSKFPVYMWYESGIIKYYSKDDTIYLNRDSSRTFRFLTRLSNINDLSGFDTSHVRNFERTFYGCSSISTLEPLRNWNTSNVKSMIAMFAGVADNPMHITDLTPLRNWDTSKVIEMQGLFQENVDLISLEGLENWNTSNVENIYGLFLGSEQNPMHLKNIKALSKWDTSKVTTMRGMFQFNIDLESLEGLEDWDTSNVTNMQSVFLGSEQNPMHLKNIKELSKWDTSKVKTMSGMFQHNIDLKSLEGLENWNTSNLTDMTATFYYNSNLENLDALKNWNTSNLKELRATFAFSDKLANINGVKNWNTSNVTTMRSTFNRTAIENAKDIENWDTSNVEDFVLMFEKCTNLKELNLSNFDMSKAKTYPDRKTEGGYLIENGEKLFFVNNVPSLKEIVTPKSYSSVPDVFIELPGKMYDSEGNEYTKLDSSSPKQVKLTVTKP